jgi:hypothetical protein
LENDIKATKAESEYGRKTFDHWLKTSYYVFESFEEEYFDKNCQNLKDLPKDQVGETLELFTNIKPHRSYSTSTELPDLE